VDLQYDTETKHPGIQHKSPDSKTKMHNIKIVCY